MWLRFLWKAKEWNWGLAILLENVHIAKTPGQLEADCDEWRWVSTRTLVAYIALLSEATAMQEPS